MRVELHCHSTCSDGSYPASEVATRALARQVELFALTDHDTFQGCAQARAALGEGPIFIPALELSCKHARRTVHVLVYGPRARVGMQALSERLAVLRIARQRRLREIVERFGRLGVSLDADAILARAHGSPGRPHVAAELVRRGVCSSIKEAFDRFLHDGGPADVSIERLTVEEGIGLATRAGARCSLAHPHTLRSEALVDELFVTFRAGGLEGIESDYGPYGAPEREAWARLAARHDLVRTGGSDFHGAANPEITAPVIDLPDDLARRVQQWLAPQEIPDDILA